MCCAPILGDQILRSSNIKSCFVCFAFLICLQEKNFASVLDFTQNNHNFTGFPGKTSSSFPEMLAGILNFPVSPVKSRPVNPGNTCGNLKFPDSPGKIPAEKSRKNWRES